MIHACGMVDLVRDLAYTPQVVARAREALRAGAPVLCDVAMVASGVTRKRLPAGNEVVCTLSDPSVPGLAAELGTTRTAAALELWRDRMEGAVVAVGNAPTALFRLLEMVREGAPRPRRSSGFRSVSSARPSPRTRWPTTSRALTTWWCADGAGAVPSRRPRSTPLRAKRNEQQHERAEHRAAVRSRARPR